MENFFLFKNTRKNTDKQPDYRVVIKEEGGLKEWGACWVKNKNGKTFLSCSKSKPKPVKKYEDGEVPADQIPF